MQQKGYTIKNMTINIRQANFLGPLSMLPFIALTFLFYYNVNGFDLRGISLGFVVAAFLLPLPILHELIHGVTWGFLQRFIFIRLILDLFGVVFSILYLLRTVGKVAIFAGNCYAYIGFRRRGGAVAAVMTNQ